MCSAGLGCSAGSKERLKNSGLGCRVLGEGAVGTVRGAPGHSLVFDGGGLSLSLPNDTALGVVLRPIRSGQRKGCQLTTLLFPEKDQSLLRSTALSGSAFLRANPGLGPRGQKLSELCILFLALCPATYRIPLGGKFQFL